MKATGYSQISLRNLTKGKLPRLPFQDIKDAVVGRNFDLSLVFVNSSAIKKLNAKHRGKNEPTDILSFALTKKSGEIFICQAVARKKAPVFKMSPDKFIHYLFIHGLLHLKGFLHGSRMEAKERFFRKRFGF